MTTSSVNKKPHGFTLMELMVVIALMGISFFVVLPRFEEAVSKGDINETVRVISANLQAQREAAISSQTVKSLFIDFEERIIGKGDQPLTPTELERKELEGKSVPEEVSVLDVEWPDGTLQNHGQAQFRISKKGYVSHAAIHLEEGERQLTVMLEPFLGRTRIYDGYVSLNSE